MRESSKIILKTIFYPLVIMRRLYFKQQTLYLGIHNPQKLANIKFKKKFGKNIDWEDPKDLNEKINWLKFNSDTTLWTEYADKYKVRKYIKACGLENTLPKLYGGGWKDSSEIDFDILSKSFVLKTNHGCGTVLLVKDKTQLDRANVCKQLNDWLKIKFGITTAEPHYLNIEPCIYAEEYLNCDSDESIIDYKFWCLDGKPYICFICYDRIIGEGTKACIYDMNWQTRQDLISGSHKDDKVLNLEKPACWDEMINACKILSKSFPQVRIDLYEVDGKMYFGEMTFTSLGGYMDYFTQECLLEMGNKVTLPK
jgi:hypothetical protein